jgi:hypothetical protein
MLKRLLAGLLKKEAPQVDTGPVLMEAHSMLRNGGQIEAHSNTWIFITNWAEAELVKAREANDSARRDEIDTATLRGRIKLLKEILELHKPKPERKRRVDHDDYDD